MKIKHKRADSEGKRIARAIDHTLLKPDTLPEQVDDACRLAIELEFAAVCVHPVMLKRVAEALKGTAVTACTVVGFPFGTQKTQVKAFEAEKASLDGAEELDMVMPVWALKIGQTNYVLSDIRSVVQAVPDRRIKVIIETCLLSDDEKKLAARLVIDAGAHFVKTSTGFNGGGATTADIRLLRKCVGPEYGVKASGGVRTAEDALKMLNAGANRIGTSSAAAFFT